MERITVTIETGNEAFTEDPGAECARILRYAANWIERDGEPGFAKLLHDFNGNQVGEIRIDPC